MEIGAGKRQRQGGENIRVRGSRSMQGSRNSTRILLESEEAESIRVFGSEAWLGTTGKGRANFAFPGSLVSCQTIQLPFFPSTMKIGKAYMPIVATC